MSQAKVYIIHENWEWTQHLTKWLEEKEIPYEDWNLTTGILNLTEAPPQGVFYNRMSASSHTRDHRYSPELADQVLKWLEFHGRTVVNGSDAIELEVSKVKQYLALEQAGIQTPKTIAVLGRERIVEAAEQLNIFPLITKHNRAGKGLGVQLFNTIEELKFYVDGPIFEPSIDGITLLQEYIQSSDGRIHRSEFINQEFLYTVSIDSSDGFKLCPADECAIGEQSEVLETSEKFKIIDPLPLERQAAYSAFLKANHVNVAAIEWVQNVENEIYVYDVNTNTNYNSTAEEAANVFAHEHLAVYLGALLNEVVVAV